MSHCGLLCANVRLAGVDGETRRRLGGAVYRGDAAEIMAVLTLDRARDVPQIAGQALLVALAQDMPDAAELAGEVISRLAERDWDGDTELGVELRDALGQPAASPLPSIPVDLEQLVDLLQGGEYHSGGRVNIRTGEAFPELAFAESSDQFDEDDEAGEDEWLYVDALGSREAYRDMERFITDAVPPIIAGPLAEAITGNGVFSRFRARIGEWPDLAAGWHLYSEERWLGRARHWLAEAGYRPGQPARR
jgi:hypothetical protein